MVLINLKAGLNPLKTNSNIDSFIRTNFLAVEITLIAIILIMFKKIQK